VEKIHACRNHCILYRGDDYKDLESCPKCGASRYKTNKDYREEGCVASVSKGKKWKKAKKKTSKSTSKEKEEVDYYALKKIPALVMWYLLRAPRGGVNRWSRENLKLNPQNLIRVSTVKPSG
jgi:hypothetical protein